MYPQEAETMMMEGLPVKMEVLQEYTLGNITVLLVCVPVKVLPQCTPVNMAVLPVCIPKKQKMPTMWELRGCSHPWASSVAYSLLEFSWPSSSSCQAWARRLPHDFAGRNREAPLLVLCCL